MHLHLTINLNPKEPSGSGFLWIIGLIPNLYSQDIARHLYFTDYTVTGKKRLFAFGTGSHQRGDSYLATP
jgi:hypothetical protein